MTKVRGSGGAKGITGSRAKKPTRSKPQRKKGYSKTSNKTKPRPPPKTKFELIPEIAPPRPPRHELIPEIAPPRPPRHELIPEIAPPTRPPRHELIPEIAPPRKPR